MAFILTDGGSNVVTYPYSVGLLRRDNPNVSFPASPSNEQLAEWNVFPVTDTAQPTIDSLTQYVTEGTPVLDNGSWTQVWEVNTYTTEEQASILAQFQGSATTIAASLFEATNKYITQALTEGLELHPDLIAYRAALMDTTTLPGYPNNIIWPTEPAQFFVGAGATKIASIDVENVVVSGSMTLGSAPIDVHSVVNKEYVDDAIAALVDSSPSALDTLNELAAALGDDANFATTVTNSIALKANSADVYTKSESDSAISSAVSTKANSSDVTSALALKADANNVYTISQIDSAFNSLAKVDAGAFSSTDASIYTDSSRTPQPDPLNIGGWYFKNISAGQKINWYPYNAGTAINNSPTVEQLTSVWAVVNFYNTTSNFILAMYSKKTGTGDAGSWYKSRWIRATKVGTIPATSVPGTPVRMLVYFGNDPGIHPELPRLQIANTLSANSNGTRLGTEELYTYSWGTNSASAVGTEEFTIEQFGHKLANQVVSRSLVHVGASLTDLAAATTGIALRDKVLNLQAPVSPSTTAVIAPALATIGTTNGYVLNLSFGNFDEAGPIVFNEKWQLNVDGPPAASTTAVTIKNGITIQNSNGVRLTRVQIEGTSSISSRAGLGLHFEKVQFMGPVTLGGTGGFMMFTDTDFGGNVTISPTFAGVIYFIRCAFSGASATYTFGQTSSQQVIVMDSSGVPNTGFVSGSTPKASYSGMITYKNVSQAHFINNVPVSTAGATSGQVLKYNGTAFIPAAEAGGGGSANTDGLLQLAGGTMTGDLTLSGAPTADLHAATKGYVDGAVSDLVNSSPEALNTLNELAAALGNDENFATTVTNSLADKANSADVYTKTESDTQLAGKLSKAGAQYTASGSTAANGSIKFDNSVVADVTNIKMNKFASNDYDINTSLNAAKNGVGEAVLTLVDSANTESKASFKISEIINEAVGTYEYAYRGFRAVYARTYDGGDPSINNVILYSDIPNAVLSPTDDDTNSEEFQISNVAAANTFAVFNLYGSTQNKISDEELLNATKAFIDNVMYTNDVLSTAEQANNNFYANFANITSPVVSGLYNGFENVDLSGNNIDDGGDDQYDGGNYINTNLEAEINYGNGEVVTGSTGFGTNSSYVSMYQDSVFAMFITGAEIENLGITGNRGADGDGFEEHGRLAISYTPPTQEEIDNAPFSMTAEYLGGSSSFNLEGSYVVNVDQGKISKSTKWKAPTNSVWQIVEVSGGKQVSYSPVSQISNQNYNYFGNSPSSIQTLTTTAESTHEGTTIFINNSFVSQMDQMSSASAVQGAKVLINGVEVTQLSGWFGYSGTNPIEIGVNNYISYVVGDTIEIQFTVYDSVNYVDLPAGTVNIVNVLNNLSQIYNNNTSSSYTVTSSSEGDFGNGPVQRIYFNGSFRQPPGGNIDLSLYTPETQNLWLNPEIDFGISPDQLRGYSLDYHIYSEDCGTLIGKIIVAIDDNPRVTNIITASGSSDVSAIDIETYDSNWYNNKGLVFRRTDNESDTIMIQWSGKAFYSPEWRD